MYFIVDSSSTVGTAIDVVNKTVVTLPDGFSVGNSDHSSTSLSDGNTHEKIYVKDLGKADIALNEFDTRLNNLGSDSDIVIVKNSTSNISNHTTYSVVYQNVTQEDYKNTSISYIFTCNHTFLIKLENYDNTSVMKDDLNFLVSNMKPDFKQSQD